ncbi:MAG: hypothetical protein ABFD65_16250 [Candidatus Polarisedimenticolia bacterium]
MRRFRFAAVVLSVVFAPAFMVPVLAGDVLRVAGHGEAQVAVVKEKQRPAANQAALAEAERRAREDAVRQAVGRVFGDRKKLGPSADEVYRESAAHSAAFVVDSEVVGADVREGAAVSDVVLRIDAARLREYLEGSLQLSLTQEAEGRFAVHVLSYTVEGADPNRSEPQVLHEEVTEDVKDVHSSASASRSTSGSAQARRSIAVGQAASATDVAVRTGRGVGVGSARSVVSAASASESAAVSYNNEASSENRSDDDSRYYHRLTVYADASKKGAGRTNEVRAKLEELLQTAGFTTAFVDVDLMGRDFANEDELCHAAWTELRKRPELSPDDFAAIALNRFTPVDGGAHRWTSQVTYRVVRLSDGRSLLPPKNVVGDSGDQASDDVARTVAVELAMRKADEVLVTEVSKALQQAERAERRQADAAATNYVVRIDNLANPAISAPLKKALRAQGFALSAQFRGEARSETISVTLAGRSGADVVGVLEGLVGDFDVKTMDERTTVLAAH